LYMQEATLLMGDHARYNPADNSDHLVDRRVADLAI
jgi:hypothetical protein